MSKINKKILIVEDDKDFLWLLKEEFEKIGFSVITAKDGHEGLTLAEKESPDLMLLDIILPKLDGISLAEELRAKNIKTPIMFLTNMKDAQHISDAIEAVHETEYMIKSDIAISDIIRKVKNKLNIDL